jgi:hypothetical protein
LLYFRSFKRKKQKKVIHYLSLASLKKSSTFPPVPVPYGKRETLWLLFRSPPAPPSLPLLRRGGLVAFSTARRGGEKLFNGRETATKGFKTALCFFFSF